MAMMNESVARVASSQTAPIESPRIHKGVVQASVKKFGMASMWACVIAGVAVFWFIATMGARIDAANYKIDNLQSQIQSQTAENASLTAKVDQLKEPSRLLQQALKDGAHYANPVTIVTGSQH
ncbi:hypothetical protein [Alicyclobacillus mengziensis]|uniref:Cell division protein FtsL n=1 Tax=Alicyclobacillus mengziensis TaxID=2931921 RepID=A0A9X7W4D6_9BACL|nr:hypothetical protein [Alicyclobacillus mengziensis]QSO49463.1 hypothetical protein JZ786_11495 [Alicyclobacillus mengziensis]